ARDRPPSGFCLDDEVVTRSVRLLAESGNRTPDEVCVARNQRVGIQSTPHQNARTEVVDHHVRVDEQLSHKLEVAPLGQVGGGAQLVAIRAEIVRALAVRIEWRAPRTGVITRSRPFDFHYVRSKITEHHRAEWTRQDPAEVQHLYSNQRKCRYHVVKLSRV